MRPMDVLSVHPRPSTLLASPVLARSDFCSRPHAGGSGSPRLGPAGATKQERKGYAVGRPTETLDSSVFVSEATRWEVLSLLGGAAGGV